MLNYGQAFYEAERMLLQLYEKQEAAAIAHEVLAELTGLSRAERLIQKERAFGSEDEETFRRFVTELAKGAPLQYVTGKAWFMGHVFYVDHRVLIPRPETEELVVWVANDWNGQRSRKGADRGLRMLDIGTGSGCIAISLALQLPEASVLAIDVSEEALAVARINAHSLNAIVQFQAMDFVEIRLWGALGQFDVIVSNPPYIPRQVRPQLERNVRDFEPELALFVPDEDPLVFYRAIAAFGKGNLNRGGSIYCELDADHAADCRAMFELAGYRNVEIRKDMHGNWRMLKADKD